MDDDMGYPQSQPDYDQDVLLVEALQAGDEQVLGEFIQRQERWVRGVVYSVLGNSPQIDDVMQRVWMNVWQRIGSLEDARRWKHWLYRMARNASIDMGRRHQRRRNLWQRLTQEKRGKLDSGVNPLQTTMAKEVHAKVLAAIDKMPAIYREPFVMRHVEQWSYKQIAETLDLPIDTVGTRLVRARRMLKENLVNKLG